MLSDLLEEYLVAREEYKAANDEVYAARHHVTQTVLNKRTRAATKLQDAKQALDNFGRGALLGG
jgi:hypothetical protein